MCFTNLENSTSWVQCFCVEQDNWALLWLSIESRFNVNELLFSWRFISKRIYWLNIWRFHHNTLENTGFSSFSNDHSVVLIESIDQFFLKICWNCLSYLISVLSSGKECVVMIPLEHLPSVILCVTLW